MESLGKRLNLKGERVDQGIAVYGNKGSTDQHAYVQQLRDGVNNFFVTPEITLHKLRVGKAHIDLRFWRDGETTRHEVRAIGGKLDVEQREKGSANKA